MSEDPVRWLDDPTLSASLRADLAHGATATVQGLDTTAGIVALRGAIGAQTGALAPAAASGSLGAKAIVGVLVIGGGLGLWKVLSTNDAGTEATREPVAVMEVEPVEPVAPPRAAIPEEAPVGKTAVVEAPVVPEPPITEVAPVAPSKRDDRSDRRRDDAKPSVTPDVPSADDKYIQEATLVARARKSLASDPTRTLALTEQIAGEFPSGQLVEERRALAIRALAKLGRLDEAKDRATDFLADYAKGPHAAAVRRAIGETP